ncbi:hypothetical protein DY000_02024224 [Brassica cretica]|uniref:Uncharacterized protein n=1 Tax=Brassica cretica TaxID=69181 RepID=A0ABQ7EJ00_BRACR|nr:hypothetical protein DY000_02024224 [Brassica cretica]
MPDCGDWRTEKGFFVSWRDWTIGFVVLVGGFTTALRGVGPVCILLCCFLSRARFCLFRWSVGKAISNDMTKFMAVGASRRHPWIVN